MQHNNVPPVLPPGIVGGLGALLIACTPLDPDGFAPVPACHHAEPPTRPGAVGRGTLLDGGVGDGGAEEDLDLFFTVTGVDYGDQVTTWGPNYRELGYDLDGVCTGGRRSRGCAPLTADPPEAEDGVDGRDNVIGRLSATVGSSLRLSQVTNEMAELGRSVILFRLQGYNGTPTDARVTLTVYAGTLWASGDAGAPQPTGDGDRWRIASFWLKSNGGSEMADAASWDARFLDEDAYVAEGRFVARLDSVPNLSAFEPIGQSLDVRVTGRLLHKDGDWKIREGIYTSRHELGTLLHVFGFILGQGPSLRCEDALSDTTVLRQLCPAADIRADGKVDRSLPCDAVSVAVAFQASQGTFGAVYDLKDVPPLCRPDPALVMARCQAMR